MLIRLAALFTLVLPIMGVRAVTMVHPPSTVISEASQPVSVLPANVSILEFTNSLHSDRRRSTNHAATANPWPPMLQLASATSPATPTRVPEPASLALIGIGLIGLVATRRRRRVNRRC